MPKAPRHATQFPEQPNNCKLVGRRSSDGGKVEPFTDWTDNSDVDVTIMLRKKAVAAKGDFAGLVGIEIWG
ncbi:hypothetical protein TWF281_001603 [Arthrobotrys megalospora]